MATKADGYHTCPRAGCTRQVPDRLFACRDDWFDLPRLNRAAIYATATLPLSNPERAEAVREALDAWKVVRE